MKLSHKKGKGLKVVSIDGNRRNRLSSTLLRTSENKRRQELANTGKPSIQRDSSAPTTKITVTANKAGNLRGTNPASHLTPEKARVVRAMRKVYNKRMPSPQCNGCAFSANCPQFKAGYECAFLPLLNAHKVETLDDIVDYMRDLLASGMRRFHQATAMETLSGAPPSLELSEQSALLFGQFKALYDLEMGAGTKITLESSDESIIGKLFGNMDSLLASTEKAMSEPIDAYAIEAPKPEETSKNAGIDEDVLDDFVKIGLEEEAKKHKKKATAVTATLV